jgi:hypothetical protein
MRRVVNKHLNTETFWRAFELAVRSGVVKTKVMCMMGLPHETQQDVIDLHNLMDEMWRRSRAIREMAAVELSVNPFIPKPHTPFQWCEHRESPYMADFVRIYNDKFNDGSYVVHDEKRGKDVVKGWRNVKGSPMGRRIEALMDNGDRRCCEPLIQSVLKFHIFSEQDWGESNSKVWTGVASYMKMRHGYELRDCIRAKDFDTPLVWEHIRTGVNKEWLWSEWEKAAKAEETHGCNFSCSGCGLNQFNSDIASSGVCGRRSEMFGEDNQTGILQTEESEKENVHVQPAT